MYFYVYKRQLCIFLCCCRCILSVQCKWTRGSGFLSLQLPMYLHLYESCTCCILFLAAGLSLKQQLSFTLTAGVCTWSSSCLSLWQLMSVPEAAAVFLSDSWCLSLKQQLSLQEEIGWTAGEDLAHLTRIVNMEERTSLNNSHLLSLAVVNMEEYSNHLFTPPLSCCWKYGGIFQSIIHTSSRLLL